MISGIISAGLLLLFVGGWIWVWQPERKAEFDAAAQLPLSDDMDDDSLIPAPASHSASPIKESRS